MPGAIGLLDIGPQRERVDLGEGSFLEVEGISAEDVRDLLKRFPGLRGIVTGLGATMDVIQEMAPGAIGAIIAIAVGKPGDEEYEKFAAKLTMGRQMQILEVVAKATWPDGGYGPFVEKLAKAFPITRAQASPAPPGRERPMRPPSVSPSSAQTSTPASGDLPLAS